MLIGKSDQRVTDRPPQWAQIEDVKMRYRAYPEAPQIGSRGIKFSRVAVHDGVEPSQSRDNPAGRMRVIAGRGQRGTLVFTLRIEAIESRIGKEIYRCDRTGEFARDFDAGLSDHKKMHTPAGAGELLSQIVSDAFDAAKTRNRKN